MYTLEQIGEGVIFFPSKNDVAAVHRDWVYGSFVKGMPETAFEVKFSKHEKNEVRDEWSKGIHGETLAIVSSGSTEITFLISGKEISQVVSDGQMVRYPNTIPHKWRVLQEGTSIVTVRSFLQPQNYGLKRRFGSLKKWLRIAG